MRPGRYCLLARSCLGVRAARCVVAPGVPLERRESRCGFFLFLVCALVLSCLIRATGWANAPRWGGRLRCWLATPLPLPQQWTCSSAVQIVTRVPLSLYLGPRLVNVVSLSYKILTANRVLVMQWTLHRTTDERSIRVPQMSGRQF